MKFQSTIAVSFILKKKKKKIHAVSLHVFGSWFVLGDGKALAWVCFCTQGSVFNKDSLYPYVPLKHGALELTRSVFLWLSFFSHFWLEVWQRKRRLTWRRFGLEAHSEVIILVPCSHLCYCNSRGSSLPINRIQRITSAAWPKSGKKPHLGCFSWGLLKSVEGVLFSAVTHECCKREKSLSVNSLPLHGDNFSPDLCYWQLIHPHVGCFTGAIWFAYWWGHYWHNEALLDKRACCQNCYKEHIGFYKTPKLAINISQPC